jgi:hypothetical protein
VTHSMLLQAVPVGRSVTAVAWQEPDRLGLSLERPLEIARCGKGSSPGVEHPGVRPGRPGSRLRRTCAVLLTINGRSTPLPLVEKRPYAELSHPTSTA